MTKQGVVTKLLLFQFHSQHVMETVMLLGRSCVILCLFCSYLCAYCM